MYAQPLPDNAARARNASALLIVNLCLFSVMTAKDILKLFAEGAFYQFYRLTLIAEGVLEIAQSVLIITTSVFFIMWFRRAYNNLWLSGARFLPYKEGWAAGGWFVPIINWFYPYRIMNAIWIETPAAIRKVGEHYERPQENYVGWWWAFWLIGNIVSSIESQVVLRGGITSGPGIYVMDFISDSALVLAAWLGWKLIKRISEMETDLAGRYNEWLAYQTQQAAQQYGQSQSFSSPKQW